MSNDEKPRWIDEEEAEKGFALILYILIWPIAVWAGFHYHLNPKPIWLWVLIMLFAPGFIGMYIGKKINLLNRKKHEK
jgi:uncharacterized membrane protein YfcA